MVKNKKIDSPGQKSRVLSSSLRRFALIPGMNAKVFSLGINDLILLIILIGICLIFFSPFLVNPKLLTIKDNDLGRTYIPIFNFFRNTFFTYKSLPLWRPDQLMGEPFVGNPLAPLFYPFNVLFLIFPINLASVIFYLLHFALAAIFTYFLARNYNFSKLSSFAAAIFYTFSTKMLLHTSAGHITMIVAFCYFPLVFLSIRKVLDRPSFIWILTGGVSFAFMLANYPTIFYYAAIFVVLYTLYYLSSYRSKFRAKTLTRTLTFLFIVFAICFALSAVYLLPQLEFAPLSTRSQLLLNDVAIPRWNFSRFAQSLLFPYFQFKAFDHEAFLYFGAVPTILLTSAFFYLKRSQKFFLLILGFITLLYIAGLSTPVFPTAYKFLPFLKYSRVTTRLWFVPALIISLLSAFALDRMKRKEIIYLAISLFLIESFIIGYSKIFEVKNLSFSNLALYQYLANDKEDFRLYCTTYCLNPQLTSKYNLKILNGETPIQYANFIDYLKKAGNYDFNQFAVIFPPYQVWQTKNPPTPNAYYLGLANVKYVLSTYNIKDADLEYINNFENIYLYKNSLFKKRVYFEDPEEQVFLEKYSPNEIVASFAPSDKNRSLIFSENYYPGWFAYQNQQKFNVEKREPLFRQITVSAYTQKLELKYQPKSFSLGKTITGLSSLLLVLIWYISLRHR